MSHFQQRAPCDAEMMAAQEARRPNPPMGYACECTMSYSRQMALVAEFHVHRIRPSRIAYRLGIDIARVEGWLSGEQDVEPFQRLVIACKKRNYQAQMKRADRFRGQQAYEMRVAAQNDLRQDQWSLR